MSLIARLDSIRSNSRAAALPEAGGDGFYPASLSFSASALSCQSESRSVTVQERSIRAGSRCLQRGLDGLEQLEAHRAVVAPQRDHKTHLPIRSGIGVTRQCADAIEGARLVQAAIMAAKQVGVRREKVEYLGETARREAVAAADARAFFEMDSFGKTLRSQVLVRDL